MSCAENLESSFAPGDVVSVDVFQRTGTLDLIVVGPDSFTGSNEPAVRLRRSGHWQGSTIVPMALLEKGGYFRASQRTLVRFNSPDEADPGEGVKRPRWRRVIDNVRRRVSRSQP